MTSTAAELVKPLSNIDKRKSTNKVIASVTVCLTATHEECNEIYRDTITGTRVVKCLCSCHIQSKDKRTSDSA